MFPYIIQIAYPCYKRPYIETIYGSETDLEKAKSNIVKELLNHIGEYIDETLYNDEPSSNPIKPWEASVFIDGKWTNCTSTFEEIYNKYKEEKAKDKESDSNEEEEEEEDEQLVSNEVEEEEEKK